MSATLEWALVDGRRMRAASMVGVPSRDRPRGVCPCCSDPITWKAGDVVVPHVAHAPGSACAATNPETAAHLNAKVRLAAMLEPLGALSIQGQCPRCRTSPSAPWEVARWSTARVEYTVGSRRPDVVLLDEAGAVVAAVEVVHTHAVDAEKARDLAALGVRWIEVSSEHALKWDGESALWIASSDASTRELLPANCRNCLRLLLAREAAEARTLEEERARRQAEIDAWLARKGAFESTMQGPVWDAYVVRRDARTAAVERLVASPPRTRIAIAASVHGARSVAGVAASLCVDGAPVRGATIRGEWSAGQAIWHALDLALRRLREVAPGRPAAIYMHVASREANHLHWQPYVTDEYGLLKRRLCEEMAAEGHVALPVSGDVGDVVRRALSRAHNEARERRTLASGGSGGRAA